MIASLPLRCTAGRLRYDLIKAAYHGTLSKSKATLRPMEFESPAELKEILGKAGIPVAQYGQGCAKSIELLWQEYAKGESLFRWAGSSPVRCVRVVTVLITDSRGKVLHEVGQTFADGRVRERRMPLSEKLLPQESAVQAARRGIVEELGTVLPSLARIDVDADSLVITTSNEDSVSYPGLLTEYTLHQVNATVDGLPSGPFETLEAEGDVGFKHLWDWL